VTEVEAQEPTRRKGRSPSYPGIDLELAVERADQLWAREHHYKVAIPVILGHWGYGPKSGGGYAALAALKSFRLLEDEGSGDERRAWLSDLGQGIVTEEDSAKRAQMIQTAALQPAIHHELWNRFGAKLPSDQTLQLFLMRERNFTPSGAGELISEWKRTLAFAGLTNGPGNLASESESAPQETALVPTPVITKEPEAPTPEASSKTKPSAERVTRTVQVTYSPSEWALLQGSFPMSEDDWDAMLEVLVAMKRGLVAKPQSD
jgi:hypothetical protein